MMTFLKKGKKLDLSLSLFSLKLFLSRIQNKQTKKLYPLLSSLCSPSLLSFSISLSPTKSLSPPSLSHFYLNLAATSLYLGRAAMSPKAAIDSGVAVAFLTAAHIDAGVSALIASTNSATGLRLP